MRIEERGRARTCYSFREKREICFLLLFGFSRVHLTKINDHDYDNDDVKCGKQTNKKEE